jgi:hypothetical protein
MLIYNFQICLLLYQWHHTTLYVKKNQSVKHFSRYNESIIIDMDYDVGFWHFKSPIYYGNSKFIHEIHTM